MHPMRLLTSWQPLLARAFLEGTRAPMETPSTPRPVEKTRGQSGGEQPGDDANATRSAAGTATPSSLRQSPGLRLLEEVLEGALCDGICRLVPAGLARPRTPRAALPATRLMYGTTFGANMNAKTLGAAAPGRCCRVLRARLPDYRLAFTFEGYEGCEPRFANIEPLGEAVYRCRGGTSASASR